MSAQSSPGKDEGKSTEVRPVPPHDLQAEESLLGAMMLSVDATTTAAAMVTAADFYKPAHGHLFTAVVALTEEGEHADSVTVADRLRRLGLLDCIGGPEVLARIMVSCPATSGALSYAGIVAHHAALRRQITAAEEVRAAGYELRLVDLTSMLQANSAGGIRLLSRDDLDSLPGPTWLVDGVLPAGGVVTMFGPPGAYKTFMALSLACSVASGSDWFGMRTVAGEAVYIAGEGASGLGRRVAAWEAAFGVRATRLLVSPEAVDLRDSLAIARVVAQVQAMDPRLVVVDTWARCMPGADENSAKDAGQAIASVDRIRQQTGATVVLLHHTPIAAEARERGSSSLPGATDTRIGVKRDGERVTLTCLKQKDAEEFSPLAFDLQPVAESLAPRAVDRTLTCSQT